MIGTDVKCWGRNDTGELGDGTTVARTKAVKVLGLPPATDVATGWYHTCAIVVGGDVKCWGSEGSWGSLGDGGAVNLVESTPVSVVGLHGAVQLAAGANHTCAIVTGGAVKCWGENAGGQLGDGTGLNSASPVDVVGLAGATQIAAGDNFTCVRVAGGVKCWGSDDTGQLGRGIGTGGSTAPVDVIGVSGVTDIGAGEFSACAVVIGGAIKCWGSNGNGRLGNGTETVSEPTPVAVTGITGATAVAPGWYHTCAVVADGAAKCWGYGIYGALGHGEFVDSLVPVDVVDVAAATQIASAYHRSCALLPAGAVKCWGYNYDGELGNGTPFYATANPVDVDLS